MANQISTQKFKEIVEKLTESGPRSRSSNGNAFIPRLPSRDDIHESIELLRSLMFPGYFGMSDVPEEFLPFRLGSMLEEVIKKLKIQILSSLCFTYPDPQKIPDHETRAEKLLAQFIETLPAIKRLLREDVEVAYEGDPACASEDEAIYCYPGIQAIANYRIANSLAALEVPLLPRIITEQAHSATGIDLHPEATIGKRFFIDHGTGVVIGQTCRIGDNVKIYQGVTLGARSFPLDKQGNPIKGVARHPIIEDDVIIYSGATILGRVTIGKGSVIGGNVWLTHDVPANSRVFQGKSQEEDAD
jgi:serine O-acetyltransferase